MQAFLGAWLDELSLMDALRLGAACRIAREALGDDGVAAAAFAVTRPWRAEPEGSLRLWRRAWDACASASCALGLPGGAWLKTAAMIPKNSSGAALTLDFGSARSVAERVITLGMVPRTANAKVIAILLTSGHGAVLGNVFDSRRIDQCEVELRMLLLLENSLFAAAIAYESDLQQLTARPLDVCDTVVADGFDTRLLVLDWPRRSRSSPFQHHPFINVRHDATTPLGPKVCLPLTRLSSGMKRVARDGGAYDIFDFALWYGGSWVLPSSSDLLSLGLRRWREAHPLAEVQDEREIALGGMLTRSAPGVCGYGDAAVRWLSE